MENSPLNYFDVDRLCVECVERNFRGDANTVGSVVSQATYMTVWNSFVKWCQSQIELGRAVNISNFGSIGFVMKNIKIITVKLSDNFMSQYDLMWNEEGNDDWDDSRGKEKISKPSVKPNYNAIAKISEQDRNSVQASLSNMFSLIGELLSESGNVEIDLGALGKISAINRSVIYAPYNRSKKAGGQRGVQTVKALLELGNDGKYKTGKAGQLEPLVRPSTDEEEVKEVPGTGYYGGSFKTKTMGSGSSPTRRFARPKGDGKIINSLLGAGVNPDATDQEFSMLASDASALMSMSFKKPGKAKSRFPPVIDPFSRTLAAPISSLIHYLPVSHRIGTNNTPTSKGYYCVDNKGIKYKKPTDQSKLFIASSSDQLEPADELEEYEALMNPDNADEERVELRKKFFERYTQYLDEEIPVDVIAPIRVYWINHILELIPADLHAIEPARVTSLVDSMLKETNEDYYNAVKKSILDYILKDDTERIRLEIGQVLNSPIDWGDNYYKGIEPEEEWKQNVMMARMLMSENLCIFSQATLNLMKLWQDYENLLFVDLPGVRKEPVDLTSFKKAQTDKINEVKAKLSTEWNKRVVENLRKELETMDEEKTKTFFESVGTLMANQVRELVTKSVDAYVDFFRRFKKEIYPTPDEIILREYDPDTEFEDNFLTLKLVIHGQNIVFENYLHDVQKDLLAIVEQVVNTSQNLPRPENTISRADKTHLWFVPADDEIVKNALNEIEDIIEENITVIEKSLLIYQDYSYILKEDARLDKYLAEQHERDEFIEEIDKLIAVSNKIKADLPYEIRMNMFLIDCSDLKMGLIKT